MAKVTHIEQYQADKADYLLCDCSASQAAPFAVEVVISDDDQVQIAAVRCPECERRIEVSGGVVGAEHGDENDGY